jgi:hypothetical protein
MYKFLVLRLWNAKSVEPTIISLFYRNSRA